MFIFNVKVNGGKIFKYFFIGIIAFLVVILGIVMFPQNGVSEIQPKNYTNVLKTVHENIDSYVGKKICFTGYVYRVLDLQDNQFVLARDMIVSSNSQSVVVGFLCECDNAKNFTDNSWVKVTGIIVKGDYHGDMPIVKVTVKLLI